MTTKPGVLLVNLGTPEAPEAKAVARYLREFLSDPMVIDLSPVGRWFLVNVVIVPRRAPVSAEAYQKVWTDQGSPLLLHHLALAKGLQQALPDLEIVPAMRYGTPSIADGLKKLRGLGCDHVILFPLYPQSAASSSGTTVAEVYKQLSDNWSVPGVSVVPPYFDDEGYIGALAEVTSEDAQAFKPDHILFSFHGLPERHVHKSDPNIGHCLGASNCCTPFRAENRNCYRAQSYETARLLADKMQLDDEAWSVSFQSRLGSTPWIQPYTDETVDQLAKQGVKRLLVACPGFAADCLETLEEIAMQCEESFRSNGGSELKLAPCLNDHPSWVAAASELIQLASPTRRD